MIANGRLDEQQIILSSKYKDQKRWRLSSCSLSGMFKPVSRIKSRSWLIRIAIPTLTHEALFRPAVLILINIVPS
jgi:hypothetical protein